MKYLTFTRPSNDFSDILSEACVAQILQYKMRWTDHLLLGFTEGEHEQVECYLTLKYGEDLRPILCEDFAPRPGVDYSPSVVHAKD